MKLKRIIKIRIRITMTINKPNLRQMEGAKKGKENCVK